MKKLTVKCKYENVLLVDDSILDNFINEKMIEATHFSKNISITTNGQEALDYIKDYAGSPEREEGNNLDWVFVDLNMPLMGGFEFITHFKTIINQRTSKCRIVILTSSIAHEDRARAKEIDPEIIFINKPLTSDFLNSI